MRGEYLIFHIVTGELLERSNEVTDKAQFLMEVWQHTYPELDVPRPFQIGSWPDSRLVMPPLACI